MRVFTNKYMKYHDKNVDHSVVEIIERSSGAANPLFLRLCLDELMMQARRGSTSRRVTPCNGA